MLLKKKLALTLAALLAMALFLPACGGGAGSAAGGDSAAAADSGTAESTAAPADAESSGQTAAGGEFVVYSTMMTEADAGHWLKDFEDENGVKITYVKSEAEDYMKTLTVAYNGGQQIDVLWINGQDIRTLGSRGVIVPLENVDYWDRFTEVAVEQCMVGDIHYAVPADTIGGMSMYYNKKLFDEHGVKLPTNMQELREAKEAFAPHGISMFGHCGGAVYMWPSWYFMLFGSTSGGRALERTEEILTGKGKFTDEDSLAAMKLLQELGDGFFQPGVNAADREAGEQVFIQGQTAMTFAGNWQLNNFRLGGMDESTLFAYAGMQFVDGEPFHTTGAAGSGNCVTICSKASDMDLAYKFLDYASSDEKVIEQRYADYLEKPWDTALLLANVNAKVPEQYKLDPTMEVFRDEMLPNMDLWLDWLWPAEVVTTAQEQIQMVVGQQTTAEEGVAAMQATLDDLIASGYVFES